MISSELLTGLSQAMPGYLYCRKLLTIFTCVQCHSLVPKPVTTGLWGFVIDSQVELVSALIKLQSSNNATQSCGMH